MKNKNILTIVGVVVVAAVAFYGGMQYDKSGSAQGAARGARNGTSTFAGGRGGFGGGASGEILSVDAQSVTVKTRDGSSRIVLYSASTPITKTASGTVSDLQNGTNVVVLGTANSDGSITAQGIQVRPNFPGGAPNGQ